MMLDTHSDFDIVICGAGPVGAAFALLLAESWSDPSRIALIDSRLPEQAVQDTRMIAISHGSRTLLERIQAWDSNTATPIHRIHVSHRGHFGRTMIEREDYGVPALGYVIRYGDLTGQLNTALSRHPFHLFRPATVKDIEPAKASCAVRLEGGDALSTQYAVHAEGGLFSTQDSKAIHRDYGQTAITGFVTCERPQAATAWERFTEDGPIALLPSIRQQQQGYAMVWCCKPDDAQRTMLLDDDAFLKNLHRNFGDRLGKFTSVSKRSAWPLGLNASTSTANGREFAIGNAAQTLHPVAGQGFNLGLRDAYSLVTVLREHFDDPETCCRRFLSVRRLDRRATIELTDLLPRIFASRMRPVIAARGTALSLLDLFPPVRHVLARQMMNGQR